MTNENKDRLDLNIIKGKALSELTLREFHQLIGEVEKLRSQNKTIAEGHNMTVDKMESMQEQIDSLTKELDKYKMEGTGISMVARNRELEVDLVDVTKGRDYCLDQLADAEKERDELLNTVEGLSNNLETAGRRIEEIATERDDYQAKLRKQEESYYLMQKRLVEDNDKLRADTDRWHKLTVEAPLCNKCGELFVSIPKMGINHICKESK